MIWGCLWAEPRLLRAQKSLFPPRQALLSEPGWGAAEVHPWMSPCRAEPTLASLRAVPWLPEQPLLGVWTLVAKRWWGELRAQPQALRCWLVVLEQT